MASGAVVVVVRRHRTGGPAQRPRQNILMSTFLLSSQIFLFMLLCGPTGALGMSAVFALRQPCAAVVSTTLPLSAQWTGVAVTSTQWVGVLLLMAMAVAEGIAFYRRQTGPREARARTRNDAGPATSGFATPKTVNAEDKSDRSRESKDTHASSDDYDKFAFETKDPSNDGSVETVDETKKRK